jgi:hypothetical protein
MADAGLSELFGGASYIILFGEAGDSTPVNSL